MAETPGKYFRKELTLIEVMRMFPDDATAAAWTEKKRWPDDGVKCPPHIVMIATFS